MNGIDTSHDSQPHPDTEKKPFDSAVIQRLMDRLREEDTGFRLNGSHLHRYRFGPVLTDSELSAFEARFQILLPPDYRFFLEHIGNGGADRSNEAVIGIHAGPGPNCGLFPLEESVLDCDPARPFPLSDSTTPMPCDAIDKWMEGQPIPGALQIGYGCGGHFWYLVVNGSAYGTVWGFEMDMIPTELTFSIWYSRWLDMLVDRALPILAAERNAKRVVVGMTKAEVIAICGGKWRETDFGNSHTLVFNNLATIFELDDDGVVVRLTPHNF